MCLILEDLKMTWSLCANSEAVTSEYVQLEWLEPLTPDNFLKYLHASDIKFPFDVADSHCSLSIDDFCSRANDIAQTIKARCEHRLLCIYLFLTTHNFSLDLPNGDLLVFKDMGNKTPNGHITSTKCRPDIIAAFEKDWLMDNYTDWALIQLAGETSKGKSQEIQMKNAATYLHYLLARPNFLVAQGLLITMCLVMFLVGTGSIGIQQLKVNWEDKDLHKFIYVFIYRLYNPSHFADPLYARTRFNKETSKASYTVDFSTKKFPGFHTIHAKNPFTTRTHVLSNPSLTQGADKSLTVIKEQLCQTGRCFDELTILTRIHQPVNVPGMVQAVDGEIIPAPLSPGREKHCLGLRLTSLGLRHQRSLARM
jgi:hypothetical protein